MSLETRVLVDGQWTTRTIDEHHIMAQNRTNPKTQAADSMPDSSKPPILGILTRTMVVSPVVRWIIPARIRHKTKNDVIFVRDRSIEIKELSTDAYLQDIALKADFDSPIRSARVLGATRKPAAPLEPRGIDAIIKQEESEPLGFFTPEIPPHILVLALESMVLVFLFAFYDSGGHFQFVTSQRSLPMQRSYLEQLGKHLAVDPRSRALAVSACSGSFVLYSLKSMDQMRKDVEHHDKLFVDRFMPVKEERHFTIEGIILKMEFLYPPDGDDHHVILLLIVSENQITRLVCYEWDCTTDLRQVKTRKGRGQPVMASDQLPILLIPFTLSTAFMLLSEKCLSVYKGILTGHADVESVILSHLETPEEPGNSKKPPRWVHWARPVRGEYYTSGTTKTYTSKNDSIYLCREDGVVRFLEIKEAPRVMVDSQMRAGRLGKNVDTAFACLDLGLKSSDLLVVGGDMSDGGLFSFAARSDAEQRQTLPNWTPLLDFATPIFTSKFQSMHEDDSFGRNPDGLRERVFACTGRGSRHGAITEIRHGFEATIVHPIDLSAFADGIVRLWSLPDLSGAGIYILLSHPVRSSLLFIPGDDQTDPEHIVDKDLAKDLDCDSRTIMAGSTPEGLIIQITEHSIRAALPLKHNRRFVQDIQGDRIVAACIQEKFSALLIVVRKDTDFHLHLGVFSTEDEQISFMKIGDSILLSSEPSSVSLYIIGEQVFAFIGTLAKTLQIFRAKIRSSLLLVFEHTLDGDVAICDSIAVLTKSKNRESLSQHIVICGLRNGSVQTFYFNCLEESNDPIVVDFEKIPLGNTSVTVITDKMRNSRAILICDQRFCTLEYCHKHFTKGFATITSIWMTIPERPAFQLAAPSAIAQPDLWNHTNAPELATTRFFCVEGTQLYVADFQIELETRVVPRRFPVIGMPVRVTYSRRLRLLIVGFIRTTIRQADQINGQVSLVDKRSLKPMITFINPDTEYLEPDPDAMVDDEMPPVEWIGIPGERILGLTEWMPSKKYHMLVVNTMLGRSPTPNVHGRILIFGLVKLGETRARMVLQKEIKQNAPVFTVAPYGESSLVWSCGNDLVFGTVETGQNPMKLHTRMTHLLKSPGIHISVKEPYIYVSTAKESLSVIRKDKDRLIPLFSDEIARDSLFHLTLPNHSLILTSDKGCTVAGLWQPPSPRLDSSTCTVFEAVLPGSITRLRHFARPPWYKSDVSGDDTQILGSGTDGSIYQFTVLSESSWRLLRFIQNMAMRHATICPVSYVNQQARHIEPSSEKCRYMHVDGDILDRVLERGGTELVQQMLRQELTTDDSLMDFKSVKTRVERFEEVAVAVVGEGKGDDLLVAVMRWMRGVLMPAL